MAYFLIQFRTCFIYFAMLGVASHVFGELLPREKFHHDRPPYLAFSWEQNGNFYNKTLRIRKWRHLLPDKSQTVKSMYTKKLGSNLTPEHLGRLLQETCVAELVHDALIILSPFVLFFADGATAVVCMTLFMVGNVPFVMIQRYNRPKLARLYRVALAKKAQADGGEEECADTVC